jgi:hypothetical protein
MTTDLRKMTDSDFVKEAAKYEAEKIRRGKDSLCETVDQLEIIHRELDMTDKAERVDLKDKQKARRDAKTCGLIATRKELEVLLGLKTSTTSNKTPWQERYQVIRKNGNWVWQVGTEEYAAVEIEGPATAEAVATALTKSYYSRTKSGKMLSLSMQTKYYGRVLKLVNEQG